MERPLASARPFVSLFAASLVVSAAPACSPSSSDVYLPPRCTILPPQLRTLRLHAGGTRLLDEAGRVVTLRGFNAGSRSKWAPYMPFDFPEGGPPGKDFGAAAGSYVVNALNQGVNVLRVPFSWQAAEPRRGEEDPVYLDRYGQILDTARLFGIRTIVDIHQDVYAENFCGDGFPAWTIDAANGPPPAPHHDCPRWYEAYSDQPVQHAFDRFWANTDGIQDDYLAMVRRVVARYKDLPGVIGFEPLNEPSSGSADRVAFEQTTLTAFHAKLAQVINEAAPEHLVFFDPVGITSALHTTSLGAPTGRNMVYAPHYYQAGTIFGATGNDKQIEPDLAMLKRAGDGWNVPTFIGEWGAGYEASDAAEYVAAHLAAFDALGLSGTQWEYSVAAERWNDEPLDVVFPDGRSRPVMQGWMRPTVTALGGTASEVRWDGDTGTLTLRYTPAATSGDAAVTEIAWPGAWTWQPHFEARITALEGACTDFPTEPAFHLLPTGTGEVRLTLEIKPLTH